MTPARLLHRLRHQGGSTLVELLVAIPTALAVGGAVAAISGVFGSAQMASADRSDVIADQQVATERMTREIRQAKAAVNPGGDPAALQITTLSGKEVRFVCAADASGGTRTCRRQVPQADSTWPAATAGTAIVRRVLNGDVFTVTGDYVELRLRVRSLDGDRELSLDDGVGLANAP